MPSRRTSTDLPSDTLAATQPGLLDHRQLSLAITGHLSGCSPFIEWGRELGDLHATLVAVTISPELRPRDFDERATRARVRELIADIDEWAVLHLPRTVNMPRHTHSLGEVVSHVAQVHAEVYRTLRGSGSARKLHDAAHRMAQTLEGYADLISAVHGRRVQLPDTERLTP
ncbi:hypothetical protein [Nocardia asteroides]|uniref:hypothetical protein n=1 Tax=Nocardia asteroides TaxID=1824 RepID=UPI001E4FB375|nr:hypothetical protein [Nocardia asteroides]UGT61337.1 hypothetical protein LTT61_30120 [Nocardia asteroides]